MLDTTHQHAQGAAWPRTPFPGLRPFQVNKDSDESLIFYGRTTDKDEILKRLNTKHLVFVIGPSGCGKSSLIKAGVIPALEAGLLTDAGYKWRATEMRPGQRPLWHLAAALARLVPDQAEDGKLVQQIYEVLRSDPNGLWLVAEFLRPKSGDPNPLLLLVDQFEEIFGLQVSSSDEMRRLVECIVRFCEKPHPNLYCIVTMRTDFLGMCANSPRLADVINDTLFMTPVLRHDELRLVTTLPPQDYHGEVDSELVGDIIEDMPAEVGYDPDHLPLLQHALLWLWHQAVADSGATRSPRPDDDPPEKPIRLSSEQYRRQGRLKGILNKHAEDIYRRLDARGQEIAEVMFRRLSERDAESRYRRSPATFGTVRKLAGCTPSELERVVALFSAPDVVFVERRLAARKGDELLDVSHESLIRQWRRLRAWADDEAEKLRRFREFAAAAGDWQRRGKSDDYLKSHTQLEFWQDWWQQNAPCREWLKRYGLLAEQLGLAEEYLKESQAKAAARQKQREQAERRTFITRLAMLAVAVLVVVSIPAVFAVINGLNRDKLELARAKVLASQASEALDRDGATRGLLIALAGLDGATRYVPELERVAYRSLQELREKQIFPSAGYFPSSSFSPRGRILMATNNSQLEFWNLETSQLIDSTPVPGFPAFVRPKWSDKGDFIVVGSGDGRTVLFAPCSRAALRPLFASCQGGATDIEQVIPGEGSDSPTWPSTLSPDGSLLLSGGFGVPPRLWDVSQPAEHEHKIRDGSAGMAIAFNGDATLLATGAVDGTVHVYDTATLTEKYTFQPSRPKFGSEASASFARRIPVNVPVSSVTFHPTNKDLLLATYNNGMLRVWNFTDATVLHERQMGAPGFMSSAVNADGTRIAVTSEDGAVKVWDPETDDVFSLRGHRRFIWSVEFSRSDDLLLSASSDSTRIWSMQAALHATVVSGQAWRMPSNSLENADGRVTIHNGVGREVSVATQASSPAVAAAVTADGTHALLALQNGELKLYDTAESIAVFRAPADVQWQAVGFLAEPDRVAALATSGEIYTWPYFKDRQALIRFAREQLPLEKGQKVELTTAERCRLGIVDAGACEPYRLASAGSRTY